MWGWGETYLNSYFTEEKTQRHEKNSISLDTEEMQVELSIRYHFNSKDWTKLKDQTVMNIVQDMKQ